MVPLKQAIDLKHRYAEQMPFNQRMMKGNISTEEYQLYLFQQLLIFSSLEELPLPHPSLERKYKIIEDIHELHEGVRPQHMRATLKYSAYLNKLNKEQLLPHIYLNYLALMFGGQMMKKNIPGSGRMYHFDDMKEAIKSIRDVQQDEWADEVNKGLDFIIEIFNELQNISKSSS